MPFRRRPPILTVRLEPQLPNPFETIHIPSSFASSSSFSAANSSPPLSRLGYSVPSTESAHSFYDAWLKAPAKSCKLDHLKGLHGRGLKLGFYSMLSLQNHILKAYVKRKAFDDACKLFDEMFLRDRVTFNVLICGLVRDTKNRFHGFSVFKLMRLSNSGLDGVTFNALINACVEPSDTVTGLGLHCLVVKQGFCNICFVCTALVDFYGKSGLVEEASQVFEEVPKRDLVLWNVIISSCVLNGFCHRALDTFSSMLSDGFKGDAFTYSCLINGFERSRLGELGKQIHGFVVKLSFESDIHVTSSLVDMYAKSGEIHNARRCFDRMEARNVVTWNTIIVGYGRNGDGREAAKLFQEMLLENFHPDELTFASILSSCGNTSRIWEIVQFQAFVIKIGLESFLSVANSLINAYAKCGNIAGALLCFASVTAPDIVSWTSVITALAFHGSAKQSIELFEKMLSDKNTSPDSIAFLGVLSACSHSGLVTEGLQYFNMMVNDYGIKPDSKHYTCLVDLLGRRGHLEVAFEVLVSMSVEPNADAFAAFFGACKVHGNREMAEWAAKKLLDLEPNKPVNHSLLSNMYASEGKWHEAAQVHETMSTCGRKASGHSWVEIADHIRI